MNYNVLPASCRQNVPPCRQDAGRTLAKSRGMTARLFSLSP